MADEIANLVDWQLAQRQPISVCRACLTQWTDSAVVACPECGNDRET